MSIFATNLPGWLPVKERSMARNLVALLLSDVSRSQRPRRHKRTGLGRLLLRRNLVTVPVTFGMTVTVTTTKIQLVK